MRITKEDLEREKREAERKAKGLPPEEESSEELAGEKKPRYDSDMTRKQRHAVEKAKLKDMKFKEKLQYIWAYYKPVIFGIIAGIFVIIFIVQQVERSRYDNVFNLGIVNSADFGKEEETQDKLRDMLGIKDKYKEVTIDTSYNFSETVEDTDPNVVMKFTTVVAAKELDCLITSEQVIDHYGKQDFFMDLSKIFTPEECEKYGINEGDIKLDITNSKWVKDNQIVYYEPVYLTVLATVDTKPKEEIGEEKLANIKKFVEDLKEED